MYLSWDNTTVPGYSSSSFWQSYIQIAAHATDFNMWYLEKPRREAGPSGDIVYLNGQQNRE